MKKYQKDINVKGHKITAEYKSLDKIYSLLPKGLRFLDIACAEGFLCWLAKKNGLTPLGIELHQDKVDRGRKHLDLGLVCGSVFDNFYMFEGIDVYMVSRFFHNVGWNKSVQIMREISKNKDYIIIVKYKPGLYKETGQKRQPLATKKGVSTLLEGYVKNRKAFPQQVIVGGVGKFEYIPDMLREHIKEPE